MLPEVLKIADEGRAGVLALRALPQKYRRTHTDLLTAVDPKRVGEHESQLRQMEADAARTALKVNKLIEVLKAVDKGADAVNRITANQIAALQYGMGRALASFQDTKESCDARTKAKARSTVGICFEKKDKLSAEQVNRLVENGGVQAVNSLISEAVTTSTRRCSAADAVSAALRNADERLEEAEQLQRGVASLNVFFLDFSAVVSEQSELLHSIEHHLLQATNAVDGANGDLVESIRLQRRLSSWQCMGSSALAVAGAAVVLSAA